MKTKWILG